MANFFEGAAPLNNRMFSLYYASFPILGSKVGMQL